MSTSCLVPLHVLFLVLSVASAQLQMSFENGIAEDRLNIRNAQLVTRLILLPPDAALRIDWSPRDNLPTALPKILLLASEQKDGDADADADADEDEDLPASQSLIVTSGTSADYAPPNTTYNCSDDTPCFRTQHVDAISFHTQAQRPFLRIDSTPTARTFIVIIRNYGQSTLSGSLFARLAPDDSADCPGWTSDPNQSAVCSQQGSCRNRVCECHPGYTGHVCDRRVIVLPLDKPFSIPPPSSPYLVQPYSNSAIVRIPLFSSVIFKISTQQRGVQFDVRILRGFIPGQDKPASRGAPIVKAVLFPSSMAFPFLPDNVSIPTIAAPGHILERVEETLINDTAASLTLYALRNPDDVASEEAVVSVLERCSRNVGCTRAPAIPLEIALVPVCLVAIAIASTAILVMVWLDRRHGFTQQADKLSVAEIERMYPKSNYHAPATECSICLCSIDTGETIRALHCEHIYHSECLDPWLTQNRASCPTCRADVRLEHLSDRRYLRRLVQFCLAPLVALRRLRDQRRALTDEFGSAPDAEAGSITYTESDNRRSLQPEPHIVSPAAPVAQEAAEVAGTDR